MDGFFLLDKFEPSCEHGEKKTLTDSDILTNKKIPICLPQGRKQGGDGGGKKGRLGHHAPPLLGL